MKLIVKFLFPLFVFATAFAQFPSQIKNVVVIVQENRTPDNLFHFLTPACPIPKGASGYYACTPSPVTSSCYDVSHCGLSNQSGTVVPVTLKGVPLSGTADPNHNHASFEAICDPDSTFKCRNDGAWHTAANGLAYGFVLNPVVTNYDGSTGHLLDPYLTLAKQYGWANFMYQTNQGPSFPAHQFLFTGTSALTNSDDAHSIFVSENGNSNKLGCLTPASTATTPIWNRMIQPTNPTASCSLMALYDANSVQECTLFNAIGPDNVGTFCGTSNNMATTVLDPNSISWKYYAPTTANSTGALWTAPMAIRSICDPQPNGSEGLCAQAPSGQPTWTY